MDVSPAELAVQSPPCRSAFITSGISARRSPASSPLSPSFCARRLPAAAWMYTPVTAAVKASRPCATSAPMTPASTSPVPPVASAGTSCGSSLHRPSGWATTVFAPLSTMTAPHSLAPLRAAPCRSAAICSMVLPVKRAISPGCGVRMRRGPSLRLLRGESASALRPSASMTIAHSACIARSTTSLPVERSRPRPGPMTSVSAPTMLRITLSCAACPMTPGAHSCTRLDIHYVTLLARKADAGAVEALDDCLFGGPPAGQAFGAAGAVGELGGRIYPGQKAGSGALDGQLDSLHRDRVHPDALHCAKGNECGEMRRPRKI